jgi:hypothetical protein
MANLTGRAVVTGLASMAVPARCPYTSPRYSADRVPAPKCDEPALESCYGARRGAGEGLARRGAGPAVENGILTEMKQILLKIHNFNGGDHVSELIEIDSVGRQTVVARLVDKNARSHIGFDMRFGSCADRVHIFHPNTRPPTYFLTNDGEELLPIVPTSEWVDKRLTLSGAISEIANFLGFRPQPVAPPVKLFSTD